MTVETQSHLRLSDDDAAAFDALIDANPGAGIFVTRAWLSGFFDDPADGAEPALVLVREQGALIGVVALSISHTLTHARVAVLGGGLGSDRVDLLAARGYESRAADGVLEWLRSTFGDRGFVLELRDVPADSSLWGAVHRAIAEDGVPLVSQPREMHTLPYLDLTECPSDSVRETAQSLARHRRWIERRCRLQIEQLDDRESVAEGLESLRRLLHLRWRHAVERSVLDDPRAIRFHRRVLPRLLAEGRLRMIQLRADDRTIAVFYGLAAGRWWGYYLAGYDRAWAGRIHLGRVTLAIAIERAAADGAVEFDFLKGTERVKYGWPVRERTTLDAHIYSDRSGAQFTRATRATRDAAVAFTKSARGLIARPPQHGIHPSIR